MGAGARAQLDGEDPFEVTGLDVARIGFADRCRSFGIATLCQGRTPDTVVVDRGLRMLCEPSHFILTFPEKWRPVVDQPS
jgi:hypothetical protein